MLIPSIDLQGGSVVQLVQGEKLAIKADDAEPWIAEVLALPARPADRSRRGDGQGRQRRHRRRHLWTASLPRRRRHPLGGAGARGAGRWRARGDRQLGAVPRRRRGYRLRRRAGRGRGPRPGDRRGGQPRRPRRDPRLEDHPADHRGGRGEGARALLRRVPLHPRGQGGADAGHRHGRHPGGPPRDRRGASPPPAASPPGRISTRWTPPAWTRWWAWRSTPGSCRSSADAEPPPPRPVLR